MKRHKKSKSQPAEQKQVGAKIDAELYRKAKAQAAIEGRKIGEVIDSAIEAYLKAHSKH